MSKITLIKHPMMKAMRRIVRRTVKPQAKLDSSSPDFVFIPKKPPTSIPTPLVRAANSKNTPIIIT